MVQVESAIQVLSKLGFIAQEPTTQHQTSTAKETEPSVGEPLFADPMRDQLITETIETLLEQIKSPNPWIALGLSPEKQPSEGVKRIFAQLHGLLSQLSQPNVQLAKDVERLHADEPRALNC